MENINSEPIKKNERIDYHLVCGQWFLGSVSQRYAPIEICDYTLPQLSEKEWAALKAVPQHCLNSTWLNNVFAYNWWLERRKEKRGLNLRVLKLYKAKQISKIVLLPVYE
jgi:hypothetical protein